MNIQLIQAFGSYKNPYRHPVGDSLRRTGGHDADETRGASSCRFRKIQKPNSDIFQYSAPAEKTKLKRAAILKSQKEMAEKEKYLYNTYVNDEVRQAILDRKIKERSLRKIIAQLQHNPEFMSELFLEPAGGDVMLALPDKVFKIVLKHLPKPEYFLKFSISKDADGRTFIEKASASQIKIFNERAINYPEVLQAVYLNRNAEEQIPAHYMSPEALDSMNITLSKYPDIIRKIYTTTDKKGNTPAHNRFYYGQAVIAHILAKDIPTANILYNTRNLKGELFDKALIWAENYRGPYTRTWDYILQNF